MNKNRILKIYGKDYIKMTKIILEEAGLYEDIIEKGCRDKIIGLKPNLVNSTPPHNGATTHPELLIGLIEYLRERGDFDIRIYESSWAGGNTREAFRNCGYDRLCKEYGIPFTDTKKDRSYSEGCRGLNLNICNSVKEIGYLINVPVLKGHCQTKITCALKNIKGLIPDEEKRRFHRMNLHEPIAHVNTAIRQDFILVDHICGDLSFEDGGNPVKRDCIMAAKDPVLIDSYVCRLLGYSIDDVPYVKIAASLGVGSTDLDHARVDVYSKKVDRDFIASAGTDPAGEFITLAKEQICDEEVPDTSRVLAVMDAVIEVDSCSACYGYLIPALDRMRQEGNFDRLMELLPEPISIGQGYRGKTGGVGVGLCTKGFDYCIKGCPPTDQEIYEGLMAYIESAGRSDLHSPWEA